MVPFLCDRSNDCQAATDELLPQLSCHSIGGPDGASATGVKFLHDFIHAWLEGGDFQRFVQVW